MQLLAKYSKPIQINDINNGNILRVFFRPVRFRAGRFIVSRRLLTCRMPDEAVGSRRNTVAFAIPWTANDVTHTANRKPAGNMYVQ